MKCAFYVNMFILLSEIYQLYQLSRAIAVSMLKKCQPPSVSAIAGTRD